MDCYLCKDAGRTQVAHRILPGGKGVCNDHVSGMVDLGSICAVSLVRPFSGAATATAVAKIKEENMPKIIEIDDAKLRQLHGQGLRDNAIGKEFGCSAVTICHHRKVLGLKANWGGGRGSGNARKAGGSAARHPESRVSSREARETATIHLSGAALDRLWNDLDLDVKAEWIEKILGN
jgi:hypothetical protein